MAAKNEKSGQQPNPVPADPTELLADPVRRRSWLLSKALESVPLDKALELARSAEAFISSAHAETAGASVPAPHQGQPPALQEPKPKKPRGVVLSAEERERLMDRLAAGARNTDLATEFGLSPRQVQGIRMGSARDIAKRRDRLQ